MIAAAMAGIASNTVSRGGTAADRPRRALLADQVISPSPTARVALSLGLARMASENEDAHDFIPAQRSQLIRVPLERTLTSRVEAFMKVEKEKKGLTGKDKSQGDLVDAGEQKLPEGLERERKRPLDKYVGRDDRSEN